MKTKLFWISVLSVLITFNMHAQNFIFNYDFTLAYLPLETLSQYEENHIVPGADKKITFFVEVNSEFLLFNLIFIGGNVRTNFYKDFENISFFPNIMSYKFFTGVRFNDFIEIGFNHFCTHPVIPYIGFRQQPIIILWEGAYQELYVKVSGSTGHKNKT